MGEHLKPDLDNNRKRRAKRRFVRFGINGLLMVTALLAVLIANETNRYRDRKVVEAALVGSRQETPIQYTYRFASLDRNGRLATSVSKLIGPRWNRVVRGIKIKEDELNERVFDSITRLRHVRSLAFSKVELTTNQTTRLRKMKSLQWLHFANTNVDQATIDSLRKALPNTFVTACND